MVDPGSIVIPDELAVTAKLAMGLLQIWRLMTCWQKQRTCRSICSREKVRLSQTGMATASARQVRRSIFTRPLDLGGLCDVQLLVRLLPKYPGFM